DPFSGSFFGVAANFADQNHRLSLGVIVEKLDGIEERSSDDRIAADPDASGLPDAKTRELIDRFVGKSAAAAHHADASLFVDAAGHDANFAFAGRDDTRAVGPDQASLVVIDDRRDTHHFDDRYSFRDADDKRDLRIGGFKNGVCCVWWGYKNDRSIGAGTLYGFGDGVENRPFQMLRAAL